MQSKLFDKMNKLQIFIPESRCLFGVSDPQHGLLSYGQCVVRIKTAGKLTAVVGQVKTYNSLNPCYLLDDVRCSK